MHKLIICLLFATSIQAFALDGEKVIISGKGNTNVHRNIKFPIFVDNEGRQIQVEFRTDAVADRWLAITAKGKSSMTLIGTKESDLLTIHAIETDQVAGDSVSVLRLDAELAWKTIKEKILLNSPNQMRLLLTSNLLLFHLSRGHRDLLKAVIALGKKAENGIPAEKIEAYLNAVELFMRMNEPPNYVALRQRLLKSQGKCENSVDAPTYAEILETI